MKRIMLKILNIIIWLLTFLFILSSSFKILSCINLIRYIQDNNLVIVFFWIIGGINSIMLTPHLYRWILHFGGE